MFKVSHAKLSEVQNSRYFQGVSMWDRLAVEVQRATTKVNLNL